MAEYERSRVIGAAPDAVFAFATDLNNLPTYLPTVQATEEPAPGRIRVRGEVRGNRYEDDGSVTIDADRRRMEWGADELNYSGWMSVGADDDAGTRSQVTVHLSFAPWTDDSGRPIAEPNIDPDPIEESLETALDSLRSLIEGTGGKDDTAAP